MIELALTLITILALFCAAVEHTRANAEKVAREHWQEVAAKKAFDAKVWHGQYTEARKALEKVESKLMEIGEK